MMDESTFRCGFIAIIGRPNVGKSTLLNRLIGQKISIISRRPQTTRTRITGIKTTENTQYLYVDTPGLRARTQKRMGNYMNKEVMHSLRDVDVVVFMVMGTRWLDGDQLVLDHLKNIKCPVILAINMVDKVKNKEELLPFIQQRSVSGNYAHIIPISALHGNHVKELESAVEKMLPLSVPLYPQDQITDKNERFLAAEFIREKLFHNLEQEIPYSTAVTISQYFYKKEVLHIHAVIWVEQKTHKKILIGKGGSFMKNIGTQARKQIAYEFGTKVYLDIWVKVKEEWSEREQLMKQLGYVD